MPDLPDWTAAPVALFQLQERTFAIAVETGTLRSLLLVPAGKTAVVTQVGLSAGGTQGPFALRGILTALFQRASGTGITDLAVSPEAPVVERNVPASAAQVVAGDTIEVIVTTQAGGGASGVFVTMSYYLAS